MDSSEFLIIKTGNGEICKVDKNIADKFQTIKNFNDIFRGEILPLDNLTVHSLDEVFKLINDMYEYTTLSDLRVLLETCYYLDAPEELYRKIRQKLINILLEREYNKEWYYLITIFKYYHSIDIIDKNEIIMELIKISDIENIKKLYVLNDDNLIILMCRIFFNFDIFKILSEYFDIDYRNNHGSTALMAASMTDNITAVRVLIENGSDVNLRDNSGNSPLMLACKRNNLNIAMSLIASGADVNLATYNGITPLNYCCHLKNVEMVSILIAAGAKN